MEVSSIGRRIFTAVPSTRQVRVGHIAHVGDAPAQNSHLGDKSSMFTCSSSPLKKEKGEKKREKGWPESNGSFVAETGPPLSHLSRQRSRKSDHAYTLWADLQYVQSPRPLQETASLYPEDPPEQRNLSLTYSSKGTSVGSLSTSLALSTQLCLCRQIRPTPNIFSS